MDGRHRPLIQRGRKPWRLKNAHAAQFDIDGLNPRRHVLKVLVKFLLANARLACRHVLEALKALEELSEL